MGVVRITVRMLIEACLQVSEWKCTYCDTLLEQVWIGAEDDPTLNYVHCPSCNTEYGFVIAFIETEVADEEEET